MKRTALMLFVAFGASCASYEYEEEVFLEVDGSGSLRVSGSLPALRALHGLEPSEALLEAPGVVTLSVRETERDGRTFLHLEARFDSFGGLCRTRAFRGRLCRFETGTTDRRLELEVPSPPRTGAITGVEAEEMMAMRYHFPSTIREHNSTGSIERGNILAWKLPVGEHLRGKPLHLQARFDRTTILAGTLRVVTLSLVTVVATVSGVLFLLVRRGRRELAIAGFPTPPDRPASG